LHLYQWITAVLVAATSVGGAGRVRSVAVTEEISAEALLESAEPAEPAGPGVLYTAYLTSIDEVMEHVNAADTLGLGFRVESYLVTADEADSAYGEFEFTLFNHMPSRVEDAD
jgi:hypothetical protein